MEKELTYYIYGLFARSKSRKGLAPGRSWKKIFEEIARFSERVTGFTKLPSVITLEFNRCLYFCTRYSSITTHAAGLPTVRRLLQFNVALTEVLDRSTLFVMKETSWVGEVRLVVPVGGGGGTMPTLRVKT